MKNLRRKSRVNQKGRSDGYQRFVWFDHYITRSEAFRCLTGNAVKVLLVLMAKYNGSNNGELWFSVRDAADKCNIAKNTAAKAFSELEDKGFIAPVERGDFTYKKRHATVWRLTMFECGDEPATKEFTRWRAPANAKSGLKN